MIWRIVRPQFWVLDRRVRQLPRIAIPLGVLLLGWGGQWVYNRFLQDKLAILSSEQGTAAIASFLPTLLFVFIFAAVLGLADILYQLYLASDLELLMAAPVPNSAIFVVKLMQCSRVTLLPAILSGGLLTALGLARQAPAPYFLFAWLMLLGAMGTTTAAMMSLVILLGRWIPAQRARSWLPVALTLASMALIPLQQPIIRWLLGQSGLIAFLTRTLVELQPLALLTAGFGGMTVLTGLIAYRIFDQAFYNGWNRFQEVPSRRRVRRRSVLPVLTRPLPSPFRFVLVKEWLVLGRTPQGLLNLAQPLVMSTVVVTFGFAAGSTMRPALFWMLLLFLGFYLTFSGGTVQTAVALEGRNLALMQSAPVKASTVLQGKFWATWLPGALIWSSILLVIGLLFEFPHWQIALLVGTTLWGMSGASLAAAAVSAWTMNFTEQDPRRRLPAPAYWLIMGLSLIMAALTITGALWLVAHLLPQSDLTVQLQALAGFGVVRALVTDSVGPPLILLGGQLAFGIGVRALWVAGVRRLEHYEGM
jgi:hypothetical protein